MSERMPLSLEKPKLEASESIKSAETAILTGEEYTEHPFARSEDRSYVFEATNGPKHIEFFGSSHVNDPEDPLFDEIAEAFRKANPQIVFVEGLRSMNLQDEAVRTRIREANIDGAKREGENYYTLEIEGITLPVLRKEPLIAYKKILGRDTDLIDIEQIQ